MRTIHMLDELASAAASPGANGPDDILPTITVEAGKRHIAADEGISALVAAEVPFYQRDRKIVRVALVKAKAADGTDLSVPGIVGVECAMMLRKLGCSARWVKWDARKRDHVRTDPPAAVAAQILSMAGEWPFAPLRGIVQCPTLRSDGSLLDQPGYDEKTGLLLVDGVSMPKIASDVRREGAEEAIDLLLGLLTEFPFDDGPDGISRSVALSMLMTPIVRGAMPVAPMHLVTKPLPGTGASYLLDCAAMIATGERCPVTAMAPKYEETEKRLVAAALSAFPIIGVDNARDIVAGDFFCQLVERPLLRPRALGSSEDHLIPNAYTIMTTGNNAAVADDMVRRTIRCGLDANVEHPEKREFSFNPLAEIRKNRGKYIRACLVIPLAYINEGQPKRNPPLPSFEDWSRMVRDPLIWLGCKDPVASQASLRVSDPRKEQLTDVFEAWKETLRTGFDNSYRTADIIKGADEQGNESLQQALLKVASTKNRGDDVARIDPKALGNWLRRHEGHIAVGAKLRADRSDANRPRWYLG